MLPWRALGEGTQRACHSATQAKECGITAGPGQVAACTSRTKESHYDQFKSPRAASPAMRPASVGFRPEVRAALVPEGEAADPEPDGVEVEPDAGVDADAPVKLENPLAREELDEAPSVATHSALPQVVQDLTVKTHCSSFAQRLAQEG